MIGEYQSPSQVARELGFSPNTLRRWIAEGRLRAVRFPTGRYRIRRADVRDLVAAGELREEAAAPGASVA